MFFRSRPVHEDSCWSLRKQIVIFLSGIGIFWLPHQSVAAMPKSSAVVEVLCPAGASTGFFIEPNLIVTTAHSVQDCKKVLLNLDDKSSITGRVLASDSKRDIALLVTANSSQIWFELSNTDAELGELLIFTASPERLTKEGTITTLPEPETSTRITFESKIVEGNSGSPIVLKNGSSDVVGMVLARGQTLGIGVASKEIRSFVEEVFFESSTGATWQGDAKQSRSKNNFGFDSFLLAFLLGSLTFMIAGTLVRRYRHSRRRQGRIRLEINVPEEENSLGN